MEKIRRNALWIAMVLLGIVIVILWPMEKLGHGSIIFVMVWLLIAIAFIIVGQVNLSQTKEKLDAVPMEIVEIYNNFENDRKSEVFWFLIKLLKLYKEINNAHLIFNTQESALEIVKKRDLSEQRNRDIVATEAERKEASDNVILVEAKLLKLKKDIL